MKYTITTITALIAIFLWSCDTIEGPYMVEFDVEQPTDTIDFKNIIEKFDTLDFIDTVETAILFEFTGWNCPMCYLGHEKIADLEKFFHEKIESVGIHAGGFADPGNEGPDFICDISNALYDKFDNPTDFPSGAVNSLNGGDLDSPTSWSSEVASDLVSTVDNPEIYLVVDVKHTDTSVIASVAGEFAMDLEGIYNLCLLIVEKEIIAPQNKLGTIIEEYEHHNVLRASMVNGVTGKTVALNPKIGKVFVFDNTFKVTNGEWNINNLVVIPFIYNTKTNILLKTMHIKPKTN